MSEESLSMVLFSGTDDKLSSAAILAVGAAAMGRKVNVFLQYWALDAFRADAAYADHGVSAEATEEGAAAFRATIEPGSGRHWSDLFSQAKSVGEVSITACALSMETLGIERKDLDALVDDVQGVAAFMGSAGGSVMFI